MNYDIEFPPISYDHYCWLLENLENYKSPPNLCGGLKDKITTANDCFKMLSKYAEIVDSMHDTTPEFEQTFRDNFVKLLARS